MPMAFGEVAVPVLFGAMAVAALVVAIFAIRAVRRAYRPAARPTRTAHDLDIKLESGGDWSPPPECLHLEPFRDGMYRKAYNVMRGR